MPGGAYVSMEEDQDNSKDVEKSSRHKEKVILQSRTEGLEHKEGGEGKKGSESRRRHLFPHKKTKRQ